MAKSDGDLFDTYGMSKMLEMINNNFQQNNSLANNEFAQQLLDRMEKLVGTQSKLTAKDIEKVFKDIFTPFLKNVYGGNAELTNALKILKSEIKNLSSRQDVSTKLMANMLTGGTSLMYSTSVTAIRSGSGNKPFNIGKEKDPEAAAKMDKIFGEQQKTSSAVSDFQDKLMSFLNIEKGQEKTKRRQFTEDLVEGLSRSKFVGGAFSDLLKLGALFVASFLKDKGPLGKALAVGLVVAAPMVANAIAGAVGKVIGALFTKSLSLIARAIFAPIRWIAGLAMGWVTQIIAAIWGSKVTGSPANIVRKGALGKAAGRWGSAAVIDSASGNVKTGVATGIGRGLIGGITRGVAGAAIGVGAHIAADKGVDPMLAHGLSGAAQGALWGSMIGPWGTAIGAAVGGLAGLIKGHYDKQEQLGTDQLRELKKQKSFWSNFGIGKKDSTPVQVSDDGTRFLEGRRVTSGYGMRFHPIHHTLKMHEGIDLAYAQGENVGALTGGKVTYAGFQKGYGNTIKVTDELGAETLYAHLDSMNNKLVGKSIKKGQVIGQAGSTGDATGPHLHYGVYYKGQLLNPEAYLMAKSSLDIAGLRAKYKEEYAGSSIPGKKEFSSYEKAYSSKEAEAYANDKIMQMVMEKAQSIKVVEHTYDKIEDTTSSATDQAEAQWQRINKEFKTESEASIIQAKEEKPLIDFPGTETCSKVLQNTINIQQQAYLQR